jgi:hypothetical protein
MIYQGVARAVAYRVPSSAYNRGESALPCVRLAGEEWRGEPT